MNEKLIAELEDAVDKTNADGLYASNLCDIATQAAAALREALEEIQRLRELIQRHEAALEWLASSKHAVDIHGCGSYRVLKCNHNWSEVLLVEFQHTPLAAIEAAMKGEK